MTTRRRLREFLKSHGDSPEAATARRWLEGLAEERENSVKLDTSSRMLCAVRRTIRHKNSAPAFVMNDLSSARIESRRNREPHVLPSPESHDAISSPGRSANPRIAAASKNRLRFLQQGVCRSPSIHPLSDRHQDPEIRLAIVLVEILECLSRTALRRA